MADDNKTEDKTAKSQTKEKESKDATKGAEGQDPKKDNPVDVRAKKKALMEQLRRLKNAQTTALSAITKKRNELADMMTDEDNLHLVKVGLSQFDELCTTYNDAHASHVAALENESDFETESKRYEDKQTSILEFRKQVFEWIKLNERLLSDEIDSVLGRKSRSSHSSRSSRSSRSSKSSRSTLSGRDREKAKLAELLIDQSMLKKQQRIKNDEENLKLEMKIAKAQAREKILSKTETKEHKDEDDPMNQQLKGSEGQPLATLGTTNANKQDGRSNLVNGSNPGNGSNPPINPVPAASSTPVNKQTQDGGNPATTSILNGNAPPFIPSTSVVTSNNLVTTDTLLSVLSLPQPEVPKFNGDITEYNTFLIAFDSRVASRTTSDADKLYYLHQHLQGEPRDIISSCFHMYPNEGYPEARRLLDKEYGDPYKISMMYLKKIHEWSVVKPEDYVGLKRLSLFLTKCNGAMKCMSYLNVLDHPPNMLSIVQKLPFYLQNKWRELACNVRQNYQKIMVYEDLVKFVASAAETANDPVYGRAYMTSHDSSHSRDTRKPRSTHQQSGKHRQESTSFATETTATSRDKPTCQLCRQQHDLDDCKQFLKKTADDRRAWLKDNRLCFGCYGTNHIAKACLQRRKCKICGKRHPTPLHIDGFTLDIAPSNNQGNTGNSSNLQTKPSPAKTSSSTGDHEHVGAVQSSSCTVDGSVILHAIVPVRIYQKGKENIVTTYAFLDNGSSGCFLTEDLQQQLNASGISTNLQLRTMHGRSCISSTVINDLVITDLDDGNPIELPKTYTRQEIPVNAQQIPKPDLIRKMKHLQRVADELPQYRPELEVGLLIGNNCPAALEPVEVIPTNGSGPFAMKLRHGWTLYGPVVVSCSASNAISSNRIMIHEVEEYKEIMAPTSILRMFEMDFSERTEESYPGECGKSQEDKKFLQLAEQEITFDDGHYTLPLPFRAENVHMPNNRSQAVSRALLQKKKMLKDEKYYADYNEFVNKVLDNGYASKVPPHELETPPGKVWYLPHHGVYNPNKPKIRVLFDCSAKFNGTSLNDQLLQGPDLTNSLVGVLTRFRLESVAFMADIESMFYRVRVPSQQRSFIRFLWWPNGDLNANLQEYEMNVHLFGAVSSPSIANFALRRAGEAAANDLVTQTVFRNFYVDDCLKSLGTVVNAKQLIEDLCSACKAGGFRLTKFISNSHDVMQSIPKEEHSKEMSKRNLDYDDLPLERALGIQWDAQADEFGFSITIKDKPPTRRGILSIVSSVYDPLGFVAPAILPAKRILQDLCREAQLGWDDEINNKLLNNWKDWLSTLPMLEKLTMPRCLKPSQVKSVISKQLHVFSDASTSGYGSVAYLRITDSENKHHVAFMAGKSRLTPLKPTTIPRLELTAAVTSVRLALMIKRELDEDFKVIYHTDSTTVLRYISNDRQRWPVFVANRVQTIRDFTDPSQWRYVSSADNPADEASRGLTVQKLIHESKWLQGPEFLKVHEELWPKAIPMDSHEDTEEPVDVHMVNVEEQGTMKRLLEYFSHWYNLKRAVAVFLTLREILRDRIATRRLHTKTKPSKTYKIGAQRLNEAEVCIFRCLHSQMFPDEIDRLSHPEDSHDGNLRPTVHRSSSLRALDPYLKDGILRVGGRLNRSSLPELTKHPAILPRKSHVTSLIIRDEHKRLGHAGRNHVLSNLRSKYWIIGANAAVRNALNLCVTCRRLRGPVQEQKMADLPLCRVDDSLPAFSYTGVDYFGPFLIREGRKEVKRYGVIFTCLVSRAVHLEVSNTLDTDSFIHALRRFTARRGNIKELHSDNGTNFVGAEKELREALKELKHDAIESALQRVGITWIFNPPSASHMGGVWERVIRTIRKVMAGLLQEHGTRLDTEAFQTLLCEVEAIINSRPLTNVSGDPDDLDPLTPNNLLIGRSNVTVSSPGAFQKEDMYVRRRWRRVQYLANLFWTRWRKEYLLLLQNRQKWQKPLRNMQVGDIVLVKDDTQPRNSWSLGQILETETDSKGFVRAVKVKTQHSTLRRPVNKLVLLLSPDVHV